jgi:DNA (cytosine-5)-methyltransferase 1
MTARELAAVQSFPDDFVFSGTKTSAYRQIANAVPPLLGKAIGIMLTKADISMRRPRTEAA